MTDKDQQKLYNLLHKAIKQANNQDINLFIVFLSEDNSYISDTINEKAIYNYEILAENKSKDIEEYFEGLVFQLSYF